jgi:hypothetical protein
VALPNKKRIVYNNIWHKKAVFVYFLEKYVKNGKNKGIRYFFADIYLAVLLLLFIDIPSLSA